MTHNNYLLTFDQRNGQEPILMRIYGPTMESVGAVTPVPYLVGSTFQGWLNDGEFWDSSAPLAGNMNLIADWTVDPKSFSGNTRVEIAGSARVGQTVHAEIREQPEPTPSSYTYQWFVDGKPIEGATNSSLAVTPELLHEMLSVEVLPVLEHYLPETAAGRSSTVQVSPGQFGGELSVSIVGAVQAGEEVTAKVTSSLSPQPELTYSWKLDGAPVPGATKPTLTLPASAAGSTIVVEVTAATTAYESATAVSPEKYVLPVQHAQLTVSEVTAGAPVTISGEGFTPGATLTVTLHSEPVVLGTMRANARGEVSGVFLVPADTQPGKHHIVVTDASGVALTSLPLTVNAALSPKPPVDPQLPVTGTELGAETGMGVAAAALLIAAAVVMARRGPRTHRERNTA